MVLLKLHDPNKSYTLRLSRSRLCAPNVSTWLLFSSDKDSLHLFDAALIILALKKSAPLNHAPIKELTFDTIMFRRCL